jgi:hypothetical protein
MTREELYASWGGIHMNKVSRARETADLLAEEFLRQRGWIEAEDVPGGSAGLWQKALPDGRVCILEEGAAADVQSAIDNDAEDAATP